MGQPTHVTSGARATFFYNGNQIGYAQGVEWQEEINLEDIETLDHLAVREHVPTRYRVTFSCEIFRTVAIGASSEKTPGSAKELGLFPKYDDILTTEGVDAVVKDTPTNKTLMLIERAKAENLSGSIRAGSVSMVNLRFRGIKCKDESEIKAQPG